MKWSLKTRLTIWMTVVMSICIMAGFAWIHFGLKSILNSKNEIFLANKADELLAAVQDNDSGGLNALEAEIKREAETYQSDGLILVLRKQPKLEVVPNSDANLKVVNRLGSMHPVLLHKPVQMQVDGSDFMVYRIAIKESEVSSYDLDLILSLQETRLILAQFDRRALLGGLAFLAVAMAGGYYFTIQALRPVAASIQTARTLKPDQMETRLPLAGTGDEIDELATTFDRAAAQAKTVAMARDWLQGGLDPALSPGDPPSLTTIRHELGGHNLACWCRPGTPCHADVLIELANR